MPLINKITKLLKTPKIFVFTIIWMMILVTIGTLAQKDMGLFAAQEKYFSSWIFWAWYFPFPGGRPTMIIMLINLSFFLFNKNLWKISKSGILIIHLGGFLLLFGGGLTAIFSSEGNIVIEEGKTSNFIEDYHYMELAIVKVSDKDFDTFTIFDHPLLKRKQI